MNYFLLDTVTKDKIEFIIGKLNPKKAVAPNPISTCVIKEFKNILKIPFIIIINISFQTGIFPEQRKIAHITPTFKTGKKTR